jgi:hypothetical protein
LSFRHQTLDAFIDHPHRPSQPFGATADLLY